MRLLFVCTGNIMRSYMAECILREHACGPRGEAAPLFEAESCGLAAEEGAPPHPEAVRSLEKLGVRPLDASASLVDEGHMDRADFALTMTRQQCYKLAARFPVQSMKCYSLVEMNGAIEMLLEARGMSLDGRDWVDGARAVAGARVEAGLARVRSDIETIPRQSVRQIPGVDMDVRLLMTEFAPCFYQASGIHDPLNGTRQDMDHCAQLVYREVTALVNGMLALALQE